MIVIRSNFIRILNDFNSFPHTLCRFQIQNPMMLFMTMLPVVKIKLFITVSFQEMDQS